MEAEFTDLYWQQRRLADLGRPAATVVYFATVECPLVRRYMPAVGEIARTYAARDVVTLVANVGSGDAFVEAAAQVVEHAPAAVFARDAEHALASACGIRRTGAVVVLDRDRRLRYRGRIDDLHGLGGSRTTPSRDDLRLALDQLLAGVPIEIGETPVAGCLLTPRAARAGGRIPTYHEDVAPILTRHCMACHRDDARGAMALAREEDVHKHAAMVVEVTDNGRMPPWFASPVEVPFQNQRGLSLAQRAAIRAWRGAGMPSGEIVDPRRHPMRVDWRMGAVDLALQAVGEVEVPAGGALPYQYVDVDHVFADEVWVEAIEIRPRAARVLQHCNLAVVAPGESFTPTRWLANYTPHGLPLLCPPEVAVRIPSGSRLVLQAYYLPNGERVADRIEVGVRFAKRTVERQVQVSVAGRDDLAIPAGARAHPVAATATLPEHAIGLALFPHMHARGRDVTVVARGPDGLGRTLLRVPNYHFGMQETYWWPAGAMSLAEGTVLEVLAHFDNSAWNPRNPEPAVAVRAGPAIADECLQVALVWYARDERLALAIDPATGRPRTAPANR